MFTTPDTFCNALFYEIVSLEFCNAIFFMELFFRKLTLDILNVKAPIKLKFILILEKVGKQSLCNIQ